MLWNLIHLFCLKRTIIQLASEMHLVEIGINNGLLRHARISRFTYQAFRDNGIPTVKKPSLIAIKQEALTERVTFKNPLQLTFHISL